MAAPLGNCSCDESARLPPTALPGGPLSRAQLSRSNNACCALSALPLTSLAKGSVFFTPQAPGDRGGLSHLS